MAKPTTPPKRDAVALLLGMDDADRIDAISALCDRLSYAELELLVATTRIRLAARGGTFGGHRDLHTRPRIEPIC